MTDYDKRSFIPTVHTVQFIKSDLGIDLNNWTFKNSDQTGGMVMCDRYHNDADDTDNRVLILADDGIGLYPDYKSWDNEDGEYDYADTLGANYEDWTGAKWDDETGDVIATAYPTDNILPALFIMAQMWSAEKYQKVTAQELPESHRAVIEYSRGLNK